jgi:DNA-binding IclR family transcriptional regulator
MEENPGATGGTRTVAAVDTALDIIDTLVEERGATTTELTEVLDYSKSAIHSHLKTLEAREYVVRDGYTYRPSLKFYDVGQQIVRDHLLAYRAGNEEVSNLGKETGEDGWIMVEEFGRGIYIYRHRGRQGVDDFPIGRPSGLHCTAAGKAILANLPEERITSLLERHGLPAVTEHTITDRETLFDELDSIRADGVAFSREEAKPGIRALACPLLTAEGAVFGSISISGPASRLKGEYFESELPERLTESANIIEIKAMNETHSYNF